MTASGQVTTLLVRARGGDRAAVSRLFREVNGQLRAIAGNLMRNERPNHILQPTALINELYLRLFAGQKLDAETTRDFYLLVARVMRHILIDQARRRDARMRSGEHVQLEDYYAAVRSDPDQIAMLILALRRLARDDARAAQIFDLYYFADRVPKEIATLLEVNVRTIQRELEFAKLWLKRELTGEANVARATRES